MYNLYSILTSTCTCSSSGRLVWPDLTEWSFRFCARRMLQSLLRRNSDLLMKLLPCFGKTLGWASYRKYHTIHSTFAIYLLQTLWSHRLPALVGQSATADFGLPEPLLFYSVYSSSYTKDFAVTLPLMLRSLAAASRPHHDIYVVCTI